MAWLLCFIATCFGIPLAASEPIDTRAVSLDAILKRKAPNVQAVQWQDSEHLIGRFANPGSGKSVSRTISMDGTLSNPLRGGELTAVSPDGSMLLQQVEDGWMLRNLGGGADHLIAGSSADETRKFVAWSPPAWSRDGRYAAIVDHHHPTGREHVFEVTNIGGVRVIDFDRQERLRKQWSSRIKIVDCLDLTVIDQIFVADMAVQPRWSPDNTLFVSQVKLFYETYTSVLRIEPGTHQVDEIYRSPGRFQFMVPAIHPDGNTIALVLDLDNRAWSDFESVLLIDAVTGKELLRLTYDLPIHWEGYVWSPEGNELYARVRDGGLDQIYAIPLEGEPRQLTRGERRHHDIDLSPDGRRLSYQTLDGYGRKDIRTLDLETGEEEIVLVVDEPDKEFDLGEWRRIRWSSTDGIRPFGYLFFPPGFDPGRRYPMLVDVHGGGAGSNLSLVGPLTLSVARGPLERHAWAALGYVVFVPDYRSTGNYGPEAIAARYAAGELAAIGDIEDIVSGTRHVIEQGFVDPSRVGILGHSAGGQRVYILLTRYDLYAAGILNEPTAPDPVSSFIRFASDAYTGSYPVGVYRQHYGGELSELPGRYKVNLMLDSYRNHTPTLIMRGNERLGGTDHMPTEVLYSILKQHGVPTRMLEFVEEGHTYSRRESAKVAFEEVRGWLEAHMPER